MSFLEDKCSLYPVVTPEEMDGFTCGDHDLDEFFTNDCFAYSKELLGKTYYEKNGFKTVFSTEQQEKDYRHITSETSLSTRLMFYDLMQTAKEYM